MGVAEAEGHVSGSKNLQSQLQPVRTHPEFQGEKKPCVSCWNQKSMCCERPGIGLCYGLRVWDDVHLNSFLP